MQDEDLRIVRIARATVALRDLVSQPVDDTARNIMQNLEPRGRDTFLKMLAEAKAPADWLSALRSRLVELRG